MQYPSENCIKLIKSFEGLRLIPYICPAGYLTVGWGQRTDNDKSITLYEAESLLRKYIDRLYRQLKRMVNVELSQNQSDALFSLVYNIGTGSFQSSTLRMKLNRKEYDAAANEFLKWCYIKGTKSKGLLRRRSLEKEIFLTE